MSHLTELSRRWAGIYKDFAPNGSRKSAKAGADSECGYSEGIGGVRLVGGFHVAPAGAWDHFGGIVYKQVVPTELLVGASLCDWSLERPLDSMSPWLGLWIILGE
jgi:hypothetical protein